MSLAQGLCKRFEMCQKDKTLNSLGFKFEMVEYNHWKVTFPASKASVYYSRSFTLDVTFGNDFPNKRPNIRFITKIYHCNVGTAGNLCLKILNDWKSNSILSDVFLNIYVLLVKPNPFSPLRPEIAEEMKKNPQQYIKNAYALSGLENF